MRHRRAFVAHAEAVAALRTGLACCAVEIYRPGFEAETIGGAASVAGQGPVEGFVLELAPVWNPLEE